MVTVQRQELAERTAERLAEGRVVLITGASRGIGAASARLFAREGARVGVNYFGSEAAAQMLVEEIVAAGGQAMAVRADVRDCGQVEAMVQQVSETYGPIDTLVINAHAHFAIAPFLEQRWEDFEAKLLGELKSAFFPCQAIAPGMIERRRGCIVAVSSGLSRVPGEGFIAHATAKSGLDAFMKSLALELGPHGIRVNVVSPGLTLTDATAFLPPEYRDAAAQGVPLRRNGLPEDVAGAILMLASDHAGFVNGAYLPVSGGIMML